MLEELAVACNSEHCRATLAREFPSVFVRFGALGLGASEEPPHITTSEWDRGDFDAWSFDCRIDDLAKDAFTLRVRDDGDRPTFALEVMNRCQRHVDRRNRHSQGQLFTRVLRRHRALHDITKPLVRADYNHALDVWQWMLRLDAEASTAAQLAALFHDIERLDSEADARVEHLALDYQMFKDAHARRGAAITDDVLADVGVSETVRARVAALVTGHERPSADDAEVVLLNDADALSFFSLNSTGYANYFGPEQTRRKVAYTWNRMSDRARRKLEMVHLRGDVRAFLQEVARC